MNMPRQTAKKKPRFDGLPAPRFVIQLESIMQYNKVEVNHGR